MKQIIISSALWLFFVSQTIGQIEKGNKYIWGELRVPDHYFNSDPHDFNVTPLITYTHFIKDGLALQSSFKYRYHHYDTDNNSDVANNMSISLGLKKYYKLNSYLFPYYGIGLYIDNVRNKTNSSFYNSNTQNIEIRNDNSNKVSISPNIEVGMMAVISPRITISANVQSSVMPISFYSFDLKMAYSLKKLPLNDTTQRILQTQKKNWIISGNFENSYRNEHQTSDKNYSWSYENYAPTASIGFGKFIKERTLIGLEFNVSTYLDNSHREDTALSMGSISSSSSKIENYGLNLYLNKYYGKNRLAFYTRYSAGVYYLKSQNSAFYNLGDPVSHYSEYFNFNLGASYGLAYFLGKHIILETRLGAFNLSKTKDYPRNISLNLLSASPYFTLNYVFLKK